MDNWSDILKNEEKVNINVDWEKMHQRLFKAEDEFHLILQELKHAIRHEEPRILPLNPPISIIEKLLTQLGEARKQLPNRNA